MIEKSRARPASAPNRRSSRGPVAGGVKGAAGDAGRGRSHQALGAREHFVRGASGKGQQQNPLRRDPAVDQVSDAVDKGACLSRACPGDDEKWSVAVNSGRGLFTIELGTEVASGTRLDRALAADIETREREGEGDVGHRPEYRLERPGSVSGSGAGRP